MRVERALFSAMCVVLAGCGSVVGSPDAGNSDAGGEADGGSCQSRAEVCNGVDDDCNGLIDDGATTASVDGGTVPFDGGTIAPDGTCTVGVGACARQGPASCVDGQLKCVVDAGVPTQETCNLIDDDCDALVDEPDPGLCPTTGQSCTAGACACATTESVCGSACVVLGSACTSGLGVCTRNGSTVCTSGAVTCNATTGTPGTEVCNALDDDCDGQTDEAGPDLCVVSGALCQQGSCSCPQGQQACNGSCRTLSAEVCDGLDNDCNNQIDEGLTITCVADPDDDGFAITGAAVSEQCPVGSRAAHGYCPVGFLAQAMAVTPDCAEGDATRYRLVSSRDDVDADIACVGPATSDCVGATAPTGRRFASACAAADDCNDTDASVDHLAATRADADGDGACVGAATQTCMGANPPVGRRLQGGCGAADDCDDANANTWQLLTVRADADGDAYCGGTNMVICAGATVPSGQRVASSCNPTSDCNDSDPSRFRIIVVRSDADADTWCSGPAVNMCVGATVPAGFSAAATCAGEDCLDTNAFATSQCLIPNAYLTNFAAKQCGVGLPLSEPFLVSPTQVCPVGFTTTNVRSTMSGSSGGSCFATSATSVTMNCGTLAFGTFGCALIADCAAQ